MTDNFLNPSYINNHGKKVSGAAAQQHLIKQNGGWVKHHKKITQKAINNYADIIAEDILNEENRELLKSKLKIVK